MIYSLKIIVPRGKEKNNMPLDVYVTLKNQKIELDEIRKVNPRPLNFLVHTLQTATSVDQFRKMTRGVIKGISLNRGGGQRWVQLLTLVCEDMEKQLAYLLNNGKSKTTQSFMQLRIDR